MKKLLLSTATMFLLIMSLGVKAQTTNYDFTFYTTDVGSPVYQYSFTVAANASTGVYDHLVSLSAGPIGNMTNYNSYIDWSSVDPYSGGTITSSSVYNFSFDYNVGCCAFVARSAGVSWVSGFPDAGYATNLTTTLPSGGGVAPEMNTSLIPQVGLLLACLFFLLGRKKEVAVPMLVV